MSAPTYPDGVLSRWCRSILYEPRDEVMVRLSLKMVALMSVAMSALFVSIHWQLLPLWALAPVYLALWAWNVPPVILMLHCTMHRPFIRTPKWLDRVHPYVMSFFFGIPTGYSVHHMGMHHVEDNVGEDLSSTIRYRRDSFLHFLAYWSRFFFLITPELVSYLRRHRRTAMARRVIIGEVGQQAVLVASLLIDWRFGLVAFAFPSFAIRFMMMAGNWGQHAFINTHYANNGLTNSITCINTIYNRRCFNDGYHIGHHMKANRHWTELPKDLLDNVETYVRQGSIVFEGIDFFLVSLLLWTGQWRVLAKCFVRLDGKARSDEEVIALLKSRLAPVSEEGWKAALKASAAA